MTFTKLTNETVFRGHPDKVCDQISDAILDAYLAQDPLTRCGVEVMGGKSAVYITGEVTSAAPVDIEAVAQRVLGDVGYDPSFPVVVDISPQSPDIAMGTNPTVGGAGDNGMMFGYACSETDQKLPKAMVILQDFAEEYDLLRQRNEYFLPDGKAQLTGVYDANGNLLDVDTFTVCYQNREIRREWTDGIIMDMVGDLLHRYGLRFPHRLLINPTGRFRLGGFEADAGLTGRKLAVDNYHAFCRIGGGAFSGKDPSKVDRSAAYKARQLAVRWLKEYHLQWCEVQLSYSIGVAQPMAIYVRTDIDSLVITPSEAQYAECEPARIIKDLDLLKPQYEQLARFGHFR